MSDARTKSKELVDKYKNGVYNGLSGMTDAAAKQCAIICVDEILSISKNLLFDDTIWVNGEGTSLEDYYEQVKAEIPSI